MCFKKNFASTMLFWIFSFFQKNQAMIHTQFVLKIYNKNFSLYKQTIISFTIKKRFSSFLLLYFHNHFSSFYIYLLPRFTLFSFLKPLLLYLYIPFSLVFLYQCLFRIGICRVSYIFLYQYTYGKKYKAVIGEIKTQTF